MIEVAPVNVDWEALHTLLCSTFAYTDDRIDPPSSLHRMTVADLADKGAAETVFCRPESDWLYVGKMAVEIADQSHQGYSRITSVRRRRGY